MLNGVVRSEASGEILRSTLLRTLREASYRMTIYTPNQQRHNQYLGPRHLVQHPLHLGNGVGEGEMV